MPRFRRTSFPANKSTKKHTITISANNNGGNGKGNGKLNPRQQLFVDEYLKDLNATQAAIRAGYSKKTAQPIGAQNLCKVMIQAAIQKRRIELADKAQIDQEWVIERYKRLIEFHVDDIYFSDGKMKPLNQIPKNALYAIQGFKNMINKTTTPGKDGDKISEVILTDLRLHNKASVLDSLARHLGMFEKDNEQGKGGGTNFNGPVQINVRLVKSGQQGEQ